MATAQIRVDRAVIGEDSTSKCAGPLFVVGAFRSGTSFFFSLLNQHSDVALLYEADLGSFYPEYFAKRLKKDWFERIEFWNGCMGRHGISPPTDLSLNPSSQDAALWLYKRYAASKEARIFGEKSPSYADCLEGLAHRFPGARFIVLWRDPLSICESVCRAGETSRFFRKRGMVSRVLAHLEKLQNDCQSLIEQGYPVLQVEYASLVENRERVMRRICKFLAISFESAMLTGAGSDLSMIPDGIHHQRVRGEDKASQIEKTEILSERTRQKIKRYQALWRRKYPSLLLSRATGDSGSNPPGAVELAVDSFTWTILRERDSAIKILYYFLPLPWLRRYRKLRG